MIDRGQQYTLITHIREQEGKEYPVELPLEIWAKSDNEAIKLAECMDYPFLMLARITEKEEWFRPFKFKATYN